MSKCKDCGANNPSQCRQATGHPCCVIEWRLQPKLRDGEPCTHAGCLSHISHPCEGCGRIGGVAPVKQVVEGSKMEWKFQSPNTWTLSDGLHSKGWITGMFDKHGAILGFVSWKNDRDGSYPVGSYPELERAKASLSPQEEVKG